MSKNSLETNNIETIDNTLETPVGYISISPLIEVAIMNNPVKYLVTASKVTPYPRVINFSIEETGESGFFYELPNSVILPADSQITTIALSPDFNGFKRDISIVKVTILPGENYLVSEENSQAIAYVRPREVPLVEINPVSTEVATGDTAEWNLSISSPRLEEFPVNLHVYKDGRKENVTVIIKPMLPDQKFYLTPFNFERVFIVVADGPGYRFLNPHEPREVVSKGKLSPLVSVTSLDEEITEGEYLQYEFTIDRALDTNLTVDLNFSGEFNEYNNSLPASVTISAGELSTTLNIPTIDNDEFTSDSVVIELSLLEGDNYLIAPDINPVQVRIIDNDEASNLPTISLRSITEFSYWGQTALFELKSTQPVLANLNVSVSIENSVENTEREINISQGTTSKIVGISTLDFGNRDLNNLTLSILEGSNYQVAEFPDNQSIVEIKETVLSVSAQNDTIDPGEIAHFNIESPVKFDEIFYFHYSINGEPFRTNFVGRTSSVTISEERQNYDHFDGNSLSFKFINGFGYKIAPSPNNSARVNVAKPNLPTISISADTLSIIKGEYVGFTISSDQVLQFSLDVGIAVRQVGNVFSGEPQSTVQLAQGTQDKTLLIKTGGDEIDQIEESVLVEILPHPDYLVSTRSYLARTNVVEDDGEVSSDNILSINSLSSSHIYGSPVKFAINSSSLLSFDIMVKLEINMDGSIITEEVEFVRGQTNTVYTISPDRYLEVEEIQVKILESIDYTVAIEPNNMATTQIEKPTISIIDFNSSTSRVENGAYRFKIYSSAFVNTNLSINLQYQATFYPTKSFTSVINFNTFQKIIEIPQSEVPNARNFRIKVLTGAGYKVAESPDNQVEINFNIAGIKLSTNEKYVVRGEPIEFKMTANTSLSADTEVFLKLSDRFTGGESIMTFTETLEAGQLTKSFYIEPEDYGSLSQIVVEILNAPDYPFSNYYRDSHWATAPKIVYIADIAKPGIVVTALQSSIKEGSGDAKFKISATPPPNVDLEVITDIAYIYNHYPYRGTSSTQNLVIPAGISSVELSVPIPDDDISMDVYDLSVTARTNANYDTQYRFAHASIEVYDNDPPILNISYVDWRITEGELAQFAVYSGNILSKTIEINLRISEVGEFIAEHNIDSVTMDAGTDFAGFAVPTVDDDEFELDGEIFAEILPSDDYLIEEGYNIDWLQVNDNDGRDAGLEITAITDSIVEGGLARFSIYTKHYTSEERTVNLSVKSLDGEFLGSDFSRFVKIPSYWSWVTVAIPTEDDEIFELDGAVEVTLEAGEGYYVSDVFKSAHVIVFDNDAPEGLSMIPTVNSIQEGESAQFLVRTDSNQYQDKTVVVEISQIGDVLSRSVDTKTVLIPRGSNTGELNVGTVDDEIDELSGYVVATLSPNQDENIISTQNRAVVLVEDNDVPAISIFSVTESVEEGNDIKYLLRTDQPVANNVFIEIGLEQEGHYIEEFATSTTAMLNLGTTEVEVSIPTLDDEVNEQDGLLTVTLLEGHGYLINPDFIANTSISIVDNDENPEVSIFADLESVEEGAEGLFTITAGRVSMFDNEINFEITGASIDFITEEIPTSLTIDAFARSASLNIPTFDDDIYGNEEEIEVILNSGDGYTVSDFANSALVTVVDNENPPLISISANANEINEGEIASFVLSSNRDSVSEFEISIQLDVSPSDLIDPNIAVYQTLTFVELTETLLYEVVTANDLVEGDNGTITVTILSGPDYEIEDGTNQATIAIGDDDGSPEISITSNTPEITEGEPVVFQISSSNPVGSDRSININAQSNFRNLYAESSSSAIILPAGETNIDLTIDAIDDDDFGADETIELTLLGGDDYRVLSENSSASIDVVDNDKPAGVSVVPIASEVNEGDLVEFLITTSSIPTSDLTIAVDIREVAGNYVSQTIPEEIIIAAGESNAVVTITTERDGEGKADGFILAKLVGGEDYVLSAENETAHVVVKNVDVPAITITGSGLITEGADAIFTISSSFVPSVDIPIEIAIEESGRFLLESPPNRVILSANSLESVLRLSTEDDDNIEQNGEILVIVNPNEGYVIADPTENRASIAVRDNDTVQISLSAENTRIVEGHQANLILTASNVPENDLIISLQAELIGDFEYSFSPVADLVDQVFQMTVPAGQRILQFQLDTVDDLILEPFGTATIALIADSEYLVDPLANQVEIDIFDNDEAAAEVYIFSHTESITEGESAIFSIRKSSSIVSNLAIDLSLADSSGDFLVSEQPQNVFLPLDELSTFIEIETIDDEVAELAGEIVVTIIPNADYTISA